MLTLENARLRVWLLPATGGGIGRFDWLGGGEPVPLMRACIDSPGQVADVRDPNQLACYPLLPWSNRIADGGFSHAGRRIDLAPNREDDPYPIHGSAWQRPWMVDRHDANAAVLTLEESSDDAYAYRAQFAYRLENDTLHVEVKVTNTGRFELPFGIGLHPFFARHGGVRLHAPADSVWMNDGVSPLPTARDAVPVPWNFTESQSLPDGGLNHAFTGWNGTAAIEWPDRFLRLHIEANVDAYVLYVPQDEAFFCFEPVDHPIDAVHLPGGAVAHGMTELAPGMSLTRTFAFRVEALDD